MNRVRALASCMTGTTFLASAPCPAEWSAADDTVTAAAKTPRIAAALVAVDRIDRAAVDGDHAAFAALLSPDLAVNNPQNSMSIGGATARLNASGRIAYSAYDRRIEYAGLRGDLVLLMGEEIVVPRLPNPMAGQQVRPVHRSVAARRRPMAADRAAGDDRDESALGKRRERSIDRPRPCFRQNLPRNVMP